MYNQHFTFYAPSQYLSFRVAGRRAKNFNFSQTFNSPQHLRPCHIQYVRCVSQGGWEEKSPSCGIVCPYSPQQLVISDTPISKLDQTTNNWSSSILIVWLKCEFYAKVYFVCQAVSKFFFLGGKQYKKYFHPLHCMFLCSLFPFRKMDFVNKIWWWIYKGILLVPPLFRAIPAKTPYIIDCIKNSTFWNEKSCSKNVVGMGPGQLVMHVIVPLPARIFALIAITKSLFMVVPA